MARILKNCLGTFVQVWIDVTYLEQEEYERLVAERAAKITEPQEDGRR